MFSARASSISTARLVISERRVIVEETQLACIDVDCANYSVAASAQQLTCSLSLSLSRLYLVDSAFLLR